MNRGGSLSDKVTTPMNEPKANILLVDDQPAKLLTYETILAGLGENLIKAASAREAMDCLLKTDVALILLDVSMPEMDGFELAAMIRQHPRFSKTAIIFISAVMMTDFDRIRGYQSGAVDYIQVPVVPEILRAKVALFIELYRKTWQLEQINQELEARVAERTAELEASVARLQLSEARLREESEARARLVDKLRFDDEQKDRFLATLAHELRNPLQPIRNAVDTLRLVGPPDTRLLPVRKIIDEQLETFTRLIDDLMDISRITQDKVQLRKERVDLAEVLRRVEEASRPVMDARGHEFEITGIPERCVMYGDMVRLCQMIMNLITNAAKYTTEPGQIKLSVSQEANQAVISVSDNGRGIEADNLPRVFEMFYQVDRSIERSESGLGIGLTLTRRLAEMHGGRIEARSEGLNKGSEFVIYLPVLEEQRETEVAERPSHGANSSGAGRRIAIADDNQVAVRSAAMLLQLLGCQVQTAEDGLAAIGVAKRFQPDAMLLDIGMPKLNGYDACRAIRELPGGEQMVLIAISGWGEDGARKRTQEAGFDAHMVKPVNYEDVLKLVNELCRPSKQPVGSRSASVPTVPLVRCDEK
jgi:signal transduction histidine kinase